MLGLALTSGLPGRLRRLRLEVHGPPSAPSIEDPLREVLGVADLLLTLPIGPARANRKPVLQVTDPAGTVLAFAKVGHNRLTRELVRHEAASLDSVGDLRLRGVRAPRVLGHVAWRDLELLVLEPLRVPTRRLTGAAARRRLEEVVRAVADLDDRPPVGVARPPAPGSRCAARSPSAGTGRRPAAAAGAAVPGCGARGRGLAR